MLVVLEGSDGAGKTMLSKILSHVLDAEVIHCTRETPNTYGYFADIIEMAKKRNIIADRFFWGQFVYQSAEERKINPTQLKDLEKQVHEGGGSIILVTAPEDVIVHRLNARNEIPSKPVQVLQDGFEELATTANCPVLRYDSFNGEVSQCR